MARGRSTRGARLRLVLGIPAAAVLLWFVTAVSTAGIFRDRAPGWALAVAPFDAGANAREAWRVLSSPQGREALDAVEAQSAAALRRDATAVSAVTTLSLTFALRNRMEQAERGFRYAEYLSRRDIGTQLWLLERDVQQDDIVGALSHFDTALRTAPAMASTLYPILVRASAEPAIAAALNRLILRRPAWSQDFVSALLAGQSDPGALYTVTRGFLRAADERERGQLALLFKRLVELNAFDIAWRAYAAARPERAKGGAGLWNGDFSREAGPAPFDWGFPDDPALVPERRRRSGGFVLVLPSGSTDNVEVARQLIRLPPGRYSVGARVGNVAGDSALRPQLTVSCAAPSPRALIRADFPAAPDRGAALAAGFSVPAGCRYQWVSLWIRGTYDSQLDTAPWVGAIRIGEP